MKPLPLIQDLKLEGRPVFMRLDLNVPLKDGKITSEARIQAALPSIKHAVQAGAKLALASHLGRPKGKRLPEASLEPVGVRLSELLGEEVLLADDCLGDGVKGMLRDLRPGRVILLENLRYRSGETKNDADMSREMAAPFEVYINDAFGASHRAHASIVGMVQHFEERGAGFLLQKEVEAIGKLLQDAPRPFVAVVGGAKVSDKLGILDALIGKVDTLCIGGAMAYTFLKAQGVQVGTSRVEDDKLRVAREILERAGGRDVELMLPFDHVAAATFEETATPTVITTNAISNDLMGLDIGQQTRERYAAKIQDAKTVFWNGPMGVFEWERFSAGTRTVAEAVGESNGYTVVGGGDSVAAIEVMGVRDKVAHVSTGGGASLEMLQYGTLPGLEALRGKL